MKKKTIVTVLTCGLIFVGSQSMAGESSIELGEKLFNDPTLGGSTNSKSCGSCHPGGEGLEKAGAKEDLTAMINRCIVGPLKGDKIDGRTVNMRSLKMYIESLGGK